MDPQDIFKDNNKRKKRLRSSNKKTKRIKRTTDPSKPSPRLPFELISYIISYTISLRLPITSNYTADNLSAASNGIQGHSTKETLKSFFVTKGIYADGKRIIKKRGSWTLKLDMRKTCVPLEIPPTWMSTSVTQLAVDVHNTSLHFSDAELEIAHEALKCIRSFCPNLISICVTIRVPPYDLDTTMQEVYVDQIEERFTRMWVIFCYALPTTVLYRFVTISITPGDEPSACDNLWIDDDAVPLRLLEGNHVALNLWPADGEWVDLEPESDGDGDEGDEGWQGFLD